MKKTDGGNVVKMNAGPRAVPKAEKPKKQARVLKAVPAATASGPVSVLIQTDMAPGELVVAMITGQVEFTR